jgi:hypothetical protein
MAVVMPGPLHLSVSADHRRLDALLRRSIAEPKPYNDGPDIRKHIEENLALARRQWATHADDGR